ncbi:MAG TPA: cell division protein ZipA, partial [Spongiibacteraceae bacterium]|nr:cell division protein ZipA [Spongiibacteraceae bacterium]
MELSVREWTIIVGVLLILAVFLDGYRRVRNERSNRIRVSLSKQVFNHHTEPVEDPSIAIINSELPNGGARVIAKQRSQNLHLRESVPVLIEPVQMPVEQAHDELEHDLGPELAEEELAVGDRRGEAVAYQHEAEEEAALIEPVENMIPVAPVIEPSRKIAEQPVEPQALEEVAPHPKAGWRKRAKQHAVEQSYLDEMMEEQRDPVEPQEVLVVNVLSKDKSGFNGADLLQILLACDLRFGKMRIFHRYENANGRGPVQFSLANLVEPGTFNLDAIDTFCTPGVSFFMTLPGPQQSIMAFNYMIETAQVLVRNLNAELRDDAHSVMTAQTIEHCRQRIRDFER